MKNFQEIIAEAEKEFDKLQLESVCHTHDCDTFCLKPFITSLISRTARLVAKKALEAVPERDTRCIGGECKLSSYPVCRHAQGSNDAHSDLKEAMGEFLKKDI